MKKRKIKTLIIEDSRLYQAYMTKILASDEQIEVGGVAGSAKEALQLLEQEKPDVITLDLGLPDVTGFELLTTLKQRYGIPIIVVTSIPKMCEKALALGAEDFVEKVQSAEKRVTEQFALLLKLKIKMQAGSFSGTKTAAARVPKVMPGHQIRDSVIVIGASLGGTEATLEILKDLPEWMPGILVVQHMPVGFTKAYAMRLDQNCRMTVKEAKSEDKVEKGTVLVARGGSQMRLYKTVDGYRVRISEDDGKHNFCPSVDVLFESAAMAAGERATGVILTGMGRDGARGMVLMHQKGSYTIGQDEETCAVYGMPRAAAEAGAVDIQLPKQEIAEHLIRRFGE
ncbi:MAG: chemotaxis-specific protein-glutamate methyltransferase CheB [Lachnospiraceae bacterium]|nr:chemotaxis-specific protein-glutamate methyltransferase CheB [Lachnospiraceae bacterium]